MQQGLRQLVEAELVYQRGVPPQATYTFKHALIQDAAYQSLLRSTRQQYHQRIAQMLDEQFPETAETQTELLAHHYRGGGSPRQAIVYWRRRGSGRGALRLCGSDRARDQGLEVLAGLPSPPTRMEQELRSTSCLGTALQATKGMPPRLWNRSTTGPGNTRSRSASPRSSCRRCSVCEGLSGAWQLPHGPELGNRPWRWHPRVRDPSSWHMPITRSAMPCSPWDHFPRPARIQAPHNKRRSSAPARGTLCLATSTLRS